MLRFLIQNHAIKFSIFIFHLIDGIYISNIVLHSNHETPMIAPTPVPPTPFNPITLLFASLLDVCFAGLPEIPEVTELDRAGWALEILSVVFAGTTFVLVPPAVALYLSVSGQVSVLFGLPVSNIVAVIEALEISLNDSSP